MSGLGAPYASTRALEIHLSALMFMCGVTLMLPGNTFDLPHYGLMERYISEFKGGVIFAITGICRVIALYLNGSVKQTPLVRLAGCAVGGGFWLTMAVAVEGNLVASGLTLPYPLMLSVALTALGSEFYSALRCGADASYLGSLTAERNPKSAGIP